MEIVQESTFREVFCSKLGKVPPVDYVVGPGRSGAVAAVYASHYLGIPMLPYKQHIPGKKALVVDTAVLTGKTIRKASRRYGNAPVVFGFDQSSIGHRLKFWYEELSIPRGVGNEYRRSEV